MFEVAVASLRRGEVQQSVSVRPYSNRVPFKVCSRGCQVPVTTEIKRCVQHGLPLKEA